MTTVILVTIDSFCESCTTGYIPTSVDALPNKSLSKCINNVDSRADLDNPVNLLLWFGTIDATLLVQRFFPRTLT